MGTVIGPPLAAALKALYPSVAVQGVDYPADAAGNANLGGSGGPTMVADAQKALSDCPNTKIVLSGYSQGAMVVHNALGSFDGSKVAAVVVFGDPLNGSAFTGVDDAKAVEVCADSDGLCDRAGSDLPVSGSHISYTPSAEAAAKAVQAIIGGTGTGSAAPATSSAA
nr:hypothetical protein B0A51_12803 [Rachicladosporium sp. CCFEE 5018]